MKHYFGKQWDTPSEIRKTGSTTGERNCPTSYILISKFSQNKTHPHRFNRSSQMHLKWYKWHQKILRNPMLNCFLNVPSCPYLNRRKTSNLLKDIVWWLLQNNSTARKARWIMSHDMHIIKDTFSLKVGADENSSELLYILHNLLSKPIYLYWKRKKKGLSGWSRRTNSCAWQDKEDTWRWWCLERLARAEGRQC